MVAALLHKGFQRQQCLHAALGHVDIHLHIRQHLPDGLIIHTGSGDLRIVAVFLIHGVEHGHLLVGLVDALLLEVFRVLDQLVRLGLRCGQLGVLIGLGLVDHRLRPLLGCLHRLEGGGHFLSRRLAVLDLYIREHQADVIFLQHLGDQLLDLHLDGFLAVGEHRVHRGGPYHVAHLALYQIPQDQLRLIGAIEVLHWVGYLIFHKKFHVDDVVIPGDHLAFVFMEGIPCFRVGSIPVTQLNILIYVDLHLVGDLHA